MNKAIAGVVLVISLTASETYAQERPDVITCPPSNPNCNQPPPPRITMPANFAASAIQQWAEVPGQDVPSAGASQLLALWGARSASVASTCRHNGVHTNACLAAMGSWLATKRQYFASTGALSSHHVVASINSPAPRPYVTIPAIPSRVKFPGTGKSFLDYVDQLGLDSMGAAEGAVDGVTFTIPQEIVTPPDMPVYQITTDPAGNVTSVSWPTPSVSTYQPDSGMNILTDDNIAVWNNISNLYNQGVEAVQNNLGTFCTDVNQSANLDRNVGGILAAGGLGASLAGQPVVGGVMGGLAAWSGQDYFINKAISASYGCPGPEMPPVPPPPNGQ